MANQKPAVKTGTLIKVTQTLVLLLFVSLLAFSAGAFIGKRVSDSEHRRAQLEGDYQAIASQKMDESMMPTAKNAEEKLSEDEIASLTEEFVSKERAEEPASTSAAPAEEPAREIASAPETASEGYKKFGGAAEKKPETTAPTATAKPDHTAATMTNTSAKTPTKVEATKAAKPETAKPMAKAEATAKDATTAAAKRVSEGKSPAPEQKEERQPQSVLPSVAGTAVGKYTVQVASYPDETQAKNHAADLKGKGWNAFYIPAEVSGKMWYRVSVGLFTSAKSATNFRREFQKESQVATAIVQKIVN